MSITKDQLRSWLEDPVTKAFLDSLKEQEDYFKEGWVYNSYETEKDANIEAGKCQMIEMILANPDTSEIYNFAQSEEEEDA